MAVYILPGGPQEAKEIEKVFEENYQPEETNVDSIQGPTPFMFETEVDRIFSTPLGA